MEKQISITNSLSILTEGIYEFKERNSDEPLISSIADYIEAWNREFDYKERENLFLKFEPDFLMTDVEIKQFERLEIEYYLPLLFSEKDYVDVEKKILEEVEQAKQVESSHKTAVFEVLKDEAKSLINESKAKSIEILSVDFILSYITMDLKPNFGLNIHAVLKVNEEIEVFEYPLGNQIDSTDCLHLPILEELISWEQSEIACNFAEYIDEVAGGDSIE